MSAASACSDKSLLYWSHMRRGLLYRLLSLLVLLFTVGATSLPSSSPLLDEEEEHQDAVSKLKQDASFQRGTALPPPDVRALAGRPKAPPRHLRCRLQATTSQGSAPWLTRLLI